VHAWAYGIHDGKIRDLGMTVSEAAALDTTYAVCIDNLGKRGGDHHHQQDQYNAGESRPAG